MKTNLFARLVSRPVVAAGIGGLLLAAASTLCAQVTEYEGFDYSVPLLQDQNGGTGWGGNAWTDPEGDTPLSNDGISLAFPASVGHTAVGGRVAFAAAGAAERRLGTSLPLNVEAAYYFSALVRRQGSFRFEFIDNGTNVRWRFGAQGDGTTNTATAGVSSDFYLNNAFPVGETVYVVCKMLAHTPTTPGDEVFLNVYRAGDTVPVIEPSVWQLACPAQNSGVTLTRLRIRNIDALPLEIDEIRIGTSFADVVGAVAAGPPAITRQPASVSAYVGDMVQLSVEAGGALPLYYQWFHETTPLAGATNVTLVLTNLQAAQAGNYTVVVSNSVSTATSAPAIVSVIEITNITVGLKALWHFDETSGLLAADATGNGNTGALFNFAGDDSQWVPSDHNGALHFNRAQSNYVEVPHSDTYAATAATRFSVAAWFRSSVPLSVNGNTYRMLEKDNTFFLLQGDGNTNNLGVGGMNFLVKKGTANNNYSVSIGQALEADRWYHIAGTYDGTALRVYLDGELKDTRLLPAPLFTTTGPLRIGSDYVAGSPGSRFDGTMDEVGIWERALQPDEIRALAEVDGPAQILQQPVSQSPYAGGSAVFTVRARGLNLRYLWYHGTNEIRTAATNVLTLLNVQAADAGDYYCKVSNDAGDTLTDVATLTVIPVTSITNGMEALWKFDDGTGLVATDATGLGRDGQLAGFAGDDSQWVAGQLNLALAFDGQSNRVVVANSSTANLGLDATFAFWLRPTSYGTLINAGTYQLHNSRILRKGGRFDLELVDDPGSVRATLRANGVPAPLQHLVALNEWQHFVIQFSGGTVTFYKNGFPVGSPVTGNLGAANTNVMVLGNYSEALTTNNTLVSTNLFAGAMDEVGIWGRRLSETEILELAGRDITGPPVIVAQPQSATRYTGSTVTFAVDATGVRPVTYTWYHGTNAIPDSNTNRLVLTNLTLAAAGSYSVTVQNAAGTATSQPAVLTLLEVAGITTGLVAYWPFDETSGAIFQDASGRGHHAALQNGAAVPGSPGVVGGAYAFDGVDDFAVVPHADDLNLDGQATISVWINPRTVAVTGDRMRIVRKDINFDFSLYTAGSRFMMYGANKTELLAPVNTVTTNQWQHLVAVIKDGTVQFFKNGRALADPIPGALGPAITNDVVIGNFGPDLSISRLFNGYMDELGIWDRALTPVEIEGIYQNGLVAKPLVAPYEPFQIRHAAVAAPGQMRLVFFSPYAGRQHVVQWTDNLSSTNWTEYSPVTFNTLSGGLMEALFNQGASPKAFYRLAILPQGPLFAEDFESGAIGWTHGGNNDTWELGAPVNGPGAAVSGTNVFATSLTGTPLPYSDCYLRSPVIDLTTANRATLTFKQWRSIFNDTTFHGAIVNVLDPNLNLLQQLSLEAGATTGYETRTLPLPPQLLGRQIVIEFRLYTDIQVLPSEAGWYIDDVKILPE